MEHESHRRVAGPVSVDRSPVPPAVPERRRADEALVRGVRRVLRENAATAGLVPGVEVQDRVARPRGTVAGPVDIDAALQVAARDPGPVGVEEDIGVRIHREGRPRERRTLRPSALAPIGADGAELSSGG
jgi:hypothetical protein